MAEQSIGLCTTSMMGKKSRSKGKVGLKLTFIDVRDLVCYCTELFTKRSRDKQTHRGNDTTQVQ